MSGEPLTFEIVPDAERERRKADEQRFGAVIDALWHGKTIRFAWERPRDKDTLRAMWVVRHKGTPLHIRRDGGGTGAQSYIAWAEPKP